jgi:hypothetical protein
MKMDIEGAEIEALGGAAESDLHAVQRVALEYHEFPRPGARDRAASALARLGFRITAIYSRDGGMGVIHALNSLTPHNCSGCWTCTAWPLCSARLTPDLRPSA